MDSFMVVVRMLTAPERDEPRGGAVIDGDLVDSLAQGICLQDQYGEHTADLANLTAVVMNNAPQEKQPEPPAAQPAEPGPIRPREIGGRDGPEPTRFGDWEKAGRCIDF
jgi:hypothetical protein